MSHISVNARAFYVVQFIELPFEGIDDYVCVPYSWLKLRKETDNRAVVAYPKDENPFITRDRAERKETYNVMWRSYMAIIKYESNCYNDAELWIATRNDYGPLVEEVSKVTVTQPMLSVNKKLRSANQNHTSKPNDNFREPLLIKLRKKKEIDEKRVKLDESAQSSSAVVNAAKVETRSPKRKQSVIIIQDHQSMECSQAEESSVPSNADESTEPRSKTPRTEQTEQALSSSVKYVDKRTEFLNIDDDDHSHRVKKPDQTINMRIPSIGQNSTHLSNTTYQTPELALQRQMQPNHLNSRQQPQRLKLRIGISMNSKDKKQMPSLQGVTKKTPPPILTNVQNSIQQALSTNNFLSNNPHLQARMSLRSTGDNNVHLITSPQNIIASETSDRQNTEMPSLPIHQPSRIQHTTAYENGYQNLCMQERLVDQSTRTNSTTKRVRFMDDIARSSVTVSHLNVMVNACQTDNETLSPNHAVTSDSDAVTDQEVISDHEMSTYEAPAETTNNIYGTANYPGHGSAYRPTAAQNSTTRSHQMNPKFILEQQMLDHFATLFKQMGSTLRHTTDMYNTLRSSILDTAEKYKKLLGSVEQFNTAGNAASNSSPSSNLIPDVPRSPEERRTKVTASASSSYQDQHSNDVANKTPQKKHNKLYRFVLPPEYNPHDTRWTLKYRTYLAGLVELVPQSGVYVSYGDLKYCQQVSKDCQSLARRLLPKVFNKNALSVCSSISETAKASNSVGSNIRPDLDNDACSVLLRFVLKHGLQRGWNTDLKPILSTLHSKMQEFRFKYGVMVEC